MHTDEDVQNLVNAVEYARQLHNKPPNVETALGALQAIFNAQAPFREQRPRVGKAHYDPECSFLAIELTDAVKDALDKAGVDYD